MAPLPERRSKKLVLYQKAESKLRRRQSSSKLRRQPRRNNTCPAHLGHLQPPARARRETDRLAANACHQITFRRLFRAASGWGNQRIEQKLVERKQLKSVQPAQEDGNATQSSAYSVKVAACFNWNRAKYRRGVLGTAASCPKSRGCAILVCKSKSARGWILLDRPRPSKHLPQYG